MSSACLQVAIFDWSQSNSIVNFVSLTFKINIWNMKYLNLKDLNNLQLHIKCKIYLEFIFCIIVAILFYLLLWYEHNQKSKAENIHSDQRLSRDSLCMSVPVVAVLTIISGCRNGAEL